MNYASRNCGELENSEARLDPHTLIQLCSILETYRSLRNGKITEEEFEFIVESVTGSSFNAFKASKLSKRSILEIVENDLKELRVSYGEEFTRKNLYERRENYKSTVEAFLRLKRLGFIKETAKGSHRVLTEKEIRQKASTIVAFQKDLDQVIAESRTGWSEDDLLMEAEVRSKPRLEILDTKKLLKMLHARISKRDIDTARQIVEILSQRLDTLSSKEVSRLAKEIRRFPALADEKLLDELLERKPSLKSKFAKKFKGSIDKSNSFRRGYSRSLGGAEAFSIYVKRYLETGNIGYLDMALSSIGESSDYNMYKRVADYLEKGIANTAPWKVIADLNNTLGENAGLVLAHIMRNSYSSFFASTLKRSILSRAKIGKFSNKRKRLLEHRVKGRPAIKQSVYRIIRRKPNPIVYREPSKYSPVVLLVDISGSLKGFASEVLFYSSVFKDVIDKMVLFSDDIMPLECSRGCDPLGIIVQTGFTGNTNLLKALIYAGSLTTKKIIVVTDLRYNTGPLEELVNYAEYLIKKKGKRLVILGVGDIDKHAAQLLGLIGAKIVYGYDHRNLLRILYREMISR